MNPTAHPVAPDEVMAFIDGELSAAETKAVSSHVDHCAGCSTLAEQFRGISRSLSPWNVETVPVKVEDAIRNAAAKAGRGVRIGKADIFLRASFWTWKQWAAGLGVAAAMLFIAVSIATSRLMPVRMARQTDTFVVAQPSDLRAENENSGKLTAGNASGQHLKLVGTRGTGRAAHCSGFERAFFTAFENTPRTYPQRTASR